MTWWQWALIAIGVVFLGLSIWGEDILRGAGWRCSTAKWNINQKRFPGIRITAVTCALITNTLMMYALLWMIIALTAWILVYLAPFIALGAIVWWMWKKFH